MSHETQSCNQLQTVTLPPNLQTIRYGAFDRCMALRTLVIPLTLQTSETINRLLAQQSVPTQSNPASIHKLLFSIIITFRFIKIYISFERLYTFPSIDLGAIPETIRRKQSAIPESYSADSQ